MARIRAPSGSRHLVTGDAVIGTLLFTALIGACPTDTPSTASATRSLDLGEVGLPTTHLAAAVPMGQSEQLANALRAAGFDETPRAPWRLFHRAVSPELAPELMRSLQGSGTVSVKAPPFGDALDAMLHRDWPEPSSWVEPETRTPDAPSALVIARLGPRPPGLSVALAPLLGPGTNFQPQTTRSPKRVTRPRVLLLDRPELEFARLGLVLTSTTPFGWPVMEAVALSIGDGPISQLGRLLRADMREEVLTSIVVEDVSGTGFATSLVANPNELSSVARALPRLLSALGSAGLTEQDQQVALRNAGGRRALRSATTRGRLDFGLLDHLRLGRARSWSDFECLTTSQIQAAARALGKATGMRLVMEGNIPPGLAAELARLWPTAEIELRRVDWAANNERSSPD